MSVELAKRLKTAVLSADSRQFYKELSIGTAKPTPEEMEGIQHYFIGSHSIHSPVSAAQFEREALEVLENLFKTHDQVVLVGGSGMFIDALCVGLDPIPKNDTIKHQLNQELEANGLMPLLEELKQKDLTYYEQVDRHNPMRIIRALEVIRLTNKTFTELRNRKPTPRAFECIRFAINHDREKLYDRINKRVNIMMEEGLLNEAKSVFEFKKLSSLNTVGYKELFDYFDDNCSLEEATDAIKQNSRRYAKRQITWFKRHNDTHWINFDTTDNMVQEVLNIIQQSSGNQPNS